MLILIKVSLIDTPLCVFVIQELFEPLLLLLLAYLEEELHYEIAVINKRPLRLVDRIDHLLILFVIEIILNSGIRDLLHPEGVIECELSLLRDLLHVSV